MKPELLARILKIIAKTGEKMIICDPISEEPFVIMSLESYEKSVVCAQLKLEKGLKSTEDLTQNSGGGIINPDAALAKESKNMVAGEWGGDEVAADDQYYMEPAE